MRQNLVYKIIITFLTITIFLLLLMRKIFILLWYNSLCNSKYSNSFCQRILIFNLSYKVFMVRRKSIRKAISSYPRQRKKWYWVSLDWSIPKSRWFSFFPSFLCPFLPSVTRWNQVHLNYNLNKDNFMCQIMWYRSLARSD